MAPFTAADIVISFKILTGSHNMRLPCHNQIAEQAFDEDDATHMKVTFCRASDAR